MSRNSSFLFQSFDIPILDNPHISLSILLFATCLFPSIDTIINPRKPLPSPPLPLLPSFPRVLTRLTRATASSELLSFLPPHAFPASRQPHFLVLTVAKPLGGISLHKEILHTPPRRGRPVVTHAPLVPFPSAA